MEACFVLTRFAKTFSVPPNLPGVSPSTISANKKTCMLHMDGERLDRLIEDADYILKSVNYQ